MKQAEQNILIEKLRSGNSGAYEQLYKTTFVSVKRYVNTNSGGDTEAEDIFQEGMMVLAQKLRSPDFVLSSSVNTYLVAVCKNLWLKQLRAQKRELVMDEGFWEHADDHIPAEEAAEQSGTKRITTVMQFITLHCKRILDFLFFKNQPMEKLMHYMGWKNKHTADNQKYKCIQQAKKAAGDIPASSI